MTRQITPLEIIRLLLAFLLATLLFMSAAIFGEIWSSENDVGGIFSLFQFLLAACVLPAFLAIFIPALLPSWRYTMIFATLTMSGITLWGLWDLLQSLTGVWEIVGALIRMSALMTGALLAALLWKQFKARWANRNQKTPVAIQPATKMPKTSPILLWLSIFSIPITYITIFASAFLVIGYSALLLMILFSLPRVPVIFIIAGFLAPVVAGWASIRALAAQFISKYAFQPAKTIPLAQRPLLKNVIQEVCQAVGTKEPDHVILHAQPTFFVTQEKMQTFDARIKGRTLAIGMPLLPFLNSQELKAILAHEFAHFSGNDTLYSIWVAPVFRSLGETIARLHANTASPQNATAAIMSALTLPSIFFLAIFYEYFASIEAIISRSREFRADWVAASHYGSNNFSSALQKVVQYSQLFGKQREETDLRNDLLFESHYRISESIEPEELPKLLQSYLDQAMDRPEGEFDSHPTIRSRIGNLPVQANTAIHTQTASEAVEVMNVAGETVRVEDAPTVDGLSESIQRELRSDESALINAYVDVMKQYKELVLRTQVPEAAS